MSSVPTPITIKILDKEYAVGCCDDERDALLAAAKYLDSRMRQVRDSGKVVGSERVAVITALNLANELLQVNRDRERLSQEVSVGLQRIASKVNAVLQGDIPLETA